MLRLLLVVDAPFSLGFTDERADDEVRSFLHFCIDILAKYLRYNETCRFYGVSVRARQLIAYADTLAYVFLCPHRIGMDSLLNVTGR